MITFHVISAVPESLASYINASIIGRARKQKLIAVKPVSLRDYVPGGKSGYRAIDDSPYGGGPGMVLKVEPIYKAVMPLQKKPKARTILFSTRGKQFTEADARRLAKYQNIILICGRYEGVDERVAEHLADEEISFGNFVLSGGEIPALAVIDAVSRKIPGVLGKHESLEEVKGSYPVYTKPEVFKPRGAKRAWNVPGVLLSGDHKKIEFWRRGLQNPKDSDILSEHS